MNIFPRFRTNLPVIVCMLAITLSAGLLQSCSGDWDVDLNFEFTIETLTEQVLVDLDPDDDLPATTVGELAEDLEMLFPIEDNPNKTLINEGTTITTDDQGEGLLEGTSEDSSCRIYLYRDTQLGKRACPRAEYEGSNYVCVEEGSASFQNCSSYLVMTDTGEAQLQGTWLLVTYLPAEQVSVFTVTEGQARIYPVTDGLSGKLGEPIEVEAGQFLYTAPDEVLKQIEGLPARAPHSLERLPGLLQYYDLSIWLDQAVVRADEASAPLPNPNILYGPPDLVASIELGQMPPNFSTRSAVGKGIFVPVSIVITNRGGEKADPFKISVFGSASDGEFLRPFYPYDAQADFYIFYNQTLPPGGQATFTGAVAFTGEVGGEAKIWVEADSCAGEEFPPEGCRVEESDEQNNFSDTLLVDLEEYR